MRTKMMTLLTGLATWAVSSVAMAAEYGSDSSAGLVAIGAGIAIGLATFGAASAQGRAASSAVEGIARNPNSKDSVFTPFILSIVFMEFQALLGFAVAFLILG